MDYRLSSAASRDKYVKNILRNKNIQTREEFKKLMIRKHPRKTKLDEDVCSLILISYKRLTGNGNRRRRPRKDKMMANRSLATAANLLDEYRFVDGRTRGQLPRIPEDEEIVPVDSHRVRGVPKATLGCWFISDDKEHIPEDEEIVPVDSHRVRGVPKATLGCCFISDDKEKDIVVLTRSKAARSTFLLAI